MTHRNDRYAEAAERPVYTALNILRVDLGSANYGSVGVVFSRHAVDPMLLLAPVDTGSWELRCNSSAPDWLKAQFPVNCAPWQDQSLVRYNIGVWTSLCVGCALTLLFVKKNPFLSARGAGKTHTILHIDNALFWDNAPIRCHTRRLERSEGSITRCSQA